MYRPRIPSASAALRVGPFDVVVSFTALPFLPWGVRSIGAVDKARVSLRPFQLPSPISPKPPAGSSVWTAEQVATLATRHYIAEAAGQVVKFVASNKLLGDPARFWSQISGAVVELRSAPARRGAGRRFRRRIASAVAEAAKTTLQHAREVTGEVEARFLEARELRAARLRLRRIEDPDQEGVDGGESNVPGSRRRALRRRDVVVRPRRASHVGGCRRRAARGGIAGRGSAAGRRAEGDSRLSGGCRGGRDGRGGQRDVRDPDLGVGAGR